MNLSFFSPVILHILSLLFHAILSRIFAKLLGLEDGDGRKNGHAKSYHSADLYSHQCSYKLTDRLPKVSSIMLSLTEIGCQVQKLYLDRGREAGSQTTKAKLF